MAPNTPIPLITIDVSKKPGEQEKPLHNRWHPDIPPVGTVKEGSLFRVETIDWTGMNYTVLDGQLQRKQKSNVGNLIVAKASWIPMSGFAVLLSFDPSGQEKETLSSVMYKLRVGRNERSLSVTQSMKSVRVGTCNSETCNYQS